MDNTHPLYQKCHIISLDHKAINILLYDQGHHHFKCSNDPMRERERDNQILTLISCAYRCIIIRVSCSTVTSGDWYTDSKMFTICYFVCSVNYYVCLLITTRTNQSGEYNRCHKQPLLLGSAHLSTGVYLLCKFRPGRGCIGYTVRPC